MNWHQVCKSKDCGGLGLKKAKTQNLALLSKLSWKVATQEDSLCVTILRDKYLRNCNITSWPRKRKASHVWRNILDTKHILDKGLKWTVEDGKSVDIWKTWWCGNSPIAISYPGNHTTSNQRIEDLIVDGRWVLDSIFHIVDNNTLASIRGIPLASYSQTPDHLTWVGSPSGNFTVAAAYDLIKKEDTDLKGWKLKLPAKIKTFIWLIPP